MDLEGHTNPTEAARHASIMLVAGLEGEARTELLARGLEAAYPVEFASACAPEWWTRPVYCGWGDQVALSLKLEGPGPERRAINYCTQGLYERWIQRLESAGVPVGTIIIDNGWSPCGVWEPHFDRWPDLRGFIDRQHDAGRRVLLWVGFWLYEGLPERWCTRIGDRLLTADAGNAGYRAFPAEDGASTHFIRAGVPQRRRVQD